MAMRKICLSLIFGLLMYASPEAQTIKSDSILLNREMTLEREYDPTIGNAVKLNQLPELREPRAPQSRVEFSDYALPYTYQPGLFTLPARSYRTDPWSSAKKGYLEVGLSSLLNIDGDLGYRILNSEDSFLSLFASHRSTHSKVKYDQTGEKQKLKLNDNLFGVDFLHNFGSVRMNLDAKYTYSAFNYYGLTPWNELQTILPMVYNPVIDKDINQANNMFEAHAGVSSDDADVLAFRFDLGYTFMKQKYGLHTEEDGSRENRLLIGAGLAKNINSELRIGIDADFTNYSYSHLPDAYTYPYSSYFPEFLVSQTGIDYSTLSLNPYLRFESGDWTLRAGVRESFQFGKRKKVNLAPDVRIDYTPGERFGLYLTAEGRIKDNSSYESYYENRYLTPYLRLTDSRTPLDLSLGFRALPLSNLKLNLFGGYELIKDEHFFYTQMICYIEGHNKKHLAGQNILPAYYDVNRFKLGGALHYDYQDMVELKLDLLFSKWSDRNDDDSIEEFTPWGKPSFTGNFNIGYKPQGTPVRLEARYHLETGRKFQMTGDDNNPIHDLSVEASYLFEDTFYFRVAANNLLFQKYDLWYGYPAQGFNFIGGIGVKF